MYRIQLYIFTCTVPVHLQYIVCSGGGAYSLQILSTPSKIHVRRRNTRKNVMKTAISGNYLKLLILNLLFITLLAAYTSSRKCLVRSAHLTLINNPLFREEVKRVELVPFHVSFHCFTKRTLRFTPLHLSLFYIVIFF
jgi:hypothetical protein